MEVFRRLSGLPHVAFFDSAMRHAELGRYSFVAADPIKWLDLSADGRDVLGSLEAGIETLTGAALPELPPFQGGWAGLFGYELACSLEEVPRAAIDEFGMPALAVGLYDVVVAFDHRAGAAWLISQGWPETDHKSRHERAADRLGEFRQRLTSVATNVAEHAPQKNIGVLGPGATVSDRGSQRADEQFFGGSVSSGRFSEPSTTFTPATCFR